MPSDLMHELKSADILLQNGIDLTGRGIISSFDRKANQMFINHDYYSWQDGPKCYQQQQEISDLFSSLHWRLYEKLPDVTSIAMFRSRHTTLFAQSNRTIPPFGILHVEHFYGEIPCAALPDEREAPLDQYDYELAESVIHALGNKTTEEMPAVLLKQFGALVFGHSPADIICKADVLEKVADLAWQMYLLGKNAVYIDYSTMNRFHALCWGESSNYMQRIDVK